MLVYNLYTSDSKSFNHLIGSESVKLPSGLTGSFNAEGFLALYNGALPGCSGNDATATLALDGKVYTAPASKLALDSISSVADGASTTLVVNSLSGSLITGMSALGQLLYDNAENGFSFGATGACQLNRILSDDFPKTIPLFSQVIPTKRSGWLSIMTQEEKAISGAVINFNPNAATTKGVFNNSHNLHHLSSTSANIVVPVFPVSCP